MGDQGMQGQAVVGRIDYINVCGLYGPSVCRPIQYDGLLCVRAAGRCTLHRRRSSALSGDPLTKCRLSASRTLDDDCAGTQYQQPGDKGSVDVVLFARGSSGTRA